MTSATDWLQELGKPLLEVARSLNLDSQLIKSEDLWSLHLEEEVNSTQLTALSSELVSRLLTVYGSDLTLMILRGEATQWNLSDGANPANLDVLNQLASKHRALTIRLTLNKRDLLARHLTDTEERRFFIFLFARRLAVALSDSLISLERNFWGIKSDSKVIILVTDSSLQIRGRYFAIYGQEHAVHWQEYEDAEEAAWQEIGVGVASEQTVPITKMYDLCRQNLRWQDGWLTHLTPLHLKVEILSRNPSDTSSEANSVKEVLALQRCLLALLYTADSTIEVEHKRNSIYMRAQTPIKVEWPSVTECLMNSHHLVDWEDAQRVTSLVEWIYNPTWTVDRLLMAQSYIAEELRSRETSGAFNALIASSERLENDLRSRWKDFISKKLDGYTEQERKLEEDVVKTTQSYDEQVGAMTKALTESGLAAGAAVLGSFLAAFSKPPFNPQLFVGGLVIYGAYVFLFPLLLGLGHQWGRFRALEEEFKSRCERVKLRLDVEKVEQVVAGSRLSATRERFRRWFFTTLTIYLLLCCGAWASAYWLTPKIIQILQPTSR